MRTISVMQKTVMGSLSISSCLYQTHLCVFTTANRHRFTRILAKLAVQFNNA